MTQDDRVEMVRVLRAQLVKLEEARQRLREQMSVAQTGCTHEYKGNRAACRRDGACECCGLAFVGSQAAWAELGAHGY